MTIVFLALPLFAMAQDQGGGIDVIDVSGPLDASALAFMANAFFDLPLGEDGRFVPYAGGGVGMARVSVDNAEIFGFDIADDDDTVFAYQLVAGLAFYMTERVALTLDYRYFATQDPEFEEEITNSDFGAEYHTHNIMAGIRVGF